MANDSLLADICGDYLFWDEARILQDKPEISPCLLETVFVWVPYGVIWVFLIPFYVSLPQYGHRPPLPWTALFLAKTVLNVSLLCLVMAEIVLTSTEGYRCDVSSPTIPAYYIGTAVQIATLVLVFCLEMYLRVLGCHSSELLFIHWFLIAVADILKLYTVATLPVWCSRSYLYAAKFAVLWIQLVLRGFADRYKNGYNAFDDDNPCPEETASAFSTITFHWMTSLVYQCYKRSLTAGELWSQRRSLRSDHVVQRLLYHWNKAKQKAMLKTERSRPPSSDFTMLYAVNPQVVDERNHTMENIAEPVDNSQVIVMEHRYSRRKVRPSLYWALAKSFGPIWLQSVFFRLLGDSMVLIQPLIIRKIIVIIQTRDNHDDHTPAWMGFAWAVGLTVTGFLKTLLWQRADHLIFRFGLSVKTSLIGAIYRKSLTLSSAAKRSSTLGEIVSLMSVDCQRIQDGVKYSHFLGSIPFIVTIAMIQIWAMMGMSMFGGLGVVVFIIISNIILGKWQQYLQRKILRLKSSRNKILNEIISGIKVLKMYTWEVPFQEKVSTIRWQEIRRLSMYAILTAISIVISEQGPFLILYALVVTYTLTQPIPYISPQMAIVTLSLVNIVRAPIILSSVVTTGVVQVYVSIGRIQEFFLKQDKTENPENKNVTSDYAIEINDGRFSWDVHITPTLQKINLQVPEGGLYAVVGQVGVGKSSLISAVLGEIERQKGTLSVKGSVAYVPQEAWIQNLTVRDNIVFGSDYDEDRYNNVLTACALRADLDMLSGGDQTEIGEKGINISGGQKQRVSLARAVYADADIYLLDDPLSAVDSHVGKFLFQNVIGGEGILKNKTRILVTHGIHWLPMVDKVLVLSDSTICEAGTYDELMAHNGVLANLVQTYLDQEEESDDEDSSSEQIELSINIPKDKSEAEGKGTNTKSEPETSGKPASKPTPNKEKEKGGRLVQDEQSQQGGVKFYVFKAYMKAMGYLVLPVGFFLLLAFQSLNVFSNFWLTYWTEDSILRNMSRGDTDEYTDRYNHYLYWYTGFGAMQLVALLTCAVITLRRLIRASGILHNQMLACIIRSPMAFFDTIPIGRIINRFSSDVDIMDDRLPVSFRILSTQLFSMVATIVVVIVNTPVSMAAIVPVAIVYFLLLKFYLPTTQKTKRLESVLRSPIYNHFSETVTGASVIRAYKCADRFIKESERRVDSNSKLFYASLASGRWVSVRFESLGNLFILAAAIFALISEDLSGGQAGLSVSYSLQITVSLNLVVQAVTDMEMNIVSAERVTEYTKLEPEAEWVVASNRPSSDWPRSGKLEFLDYKTRYREGLELTLKGITCTIQSGEKIGIVGRTGAGKSSLALSLFRLIESAGGSILLDGINVADIGLHDIRDKLTILPQDPVIFSGTLRENLNPFNKYDDGQLWRALECAHLKSGVEGMKGQLNFECGEGGSNLSVGQRQLVCLARTLLHKTKVLILDEATSAVDLETDELIQTTIRTEFSDCTILTIAHRLNTVMDYDRVMVLSEGRILEMDSPTTLLANPDGAFYKMARDAGLV